MNQFVKNTKPALWSDQYNRINVVMSICGGLIIYIIWKNLAQNPNFLFYTPYNCYPIEIFLIIFIMHLILAVSSYHIDKYISNLLLSALQFYLILIIILELYYWFSF